MQRLKRSQFLRGLAASQRGLVRDLHVLTQVLLRKAVIHDYLREHSVRRLQLGASNNLLPAWLNTDIVGKNGTVYLDATQPFPFADSTFEYIFSEHMIEHISHQAAQTMLRECYRVLRPGGRIRIATPDLGVLLGLHNSEKTEAQRHYIDWATERFLPDIRECRDVFVINNFFRSWGHAFLYDRAALGHTVMRAGFCDIKFFRPGESDDSNLQNLESHGKELQSEEINQFETMVIEAARS